MKVRHDSTSERRLDAKWENGAALDDPLDPNIWGPADTTVLAIGDLLVARESTHGDFVVTSVQHEALDGIAVKLARILSGDPYHRDHWLDLAGYIDLLLREFDADGRR
jgi:hypothetical protein